MTVVLNKPFIFLELIRTRQVSKMSDLEQTRTEKNGTTPDTKGQETVSHVEAQESTLTSKIQEPIPDTSECKYKIKGPGSKHKE